MDVASSRSMRMSNQGQGQRIQVNMFMVGDTTNSGIVLVRPFDRESRGDVGDDAGRPDGKGVRVEAGAEAVNGDRDVPDEIVCTPCVPQ